MREKRKRMDAVSSLRALVYAGGVVIRGAKLHALIRLRDTMALHEASCDACVRHEARADWLSYEAAVLSANGADVVIAARSHERASRSPSAIARSVRDGKWVYTADAVIRKISSSLTLDRTDIGASIESIIAAQRGPVEIVTRGGALARLEAARETLVRACTPSAAKEIAALALPEIHAAIVQAPLTERASMGLYDAPAALMMAHTAHRDGTGGLRRLHADAACLLHAAGLSDHIGTVLNRIGIAEFEVYATTLALAQK